jgi:hypothetical protein
MTLSAIAKPAAMCATFRIGEKLFGEPVVLHRAAELGLAAHRLQATMRRRLPGLALLRSS